MDRGIGYLRQSQRADGSWPDTRHDMRGGDTALATLALLTAGVPPTDRSAAAGLRALRTLNSSKTYVVGLQTMALAMGEPQRDKRRITELADRIAKGQYSRGRWQGMWGYDLRRPRRADNSNTQFALLGLKAAADVGVKISQRVWKRSLNHWTTNQGRNGGWGYTGRGDRGIKRNLAAVTVNRDFRVGAAGRCTARR